MMRSDPDSRSQTDLDVHVRGAAPEVCKSKVPSKGNSMVANQFEAKKVKEEEKKAKKTKAAKAAKKAKAKVKAKPKEAKEEEKAKVAKKAKPAKATKKAKVKKKKAKAAKAKVKAEKAKAKAKAEKAKKKANGKATATAKKATVTATTLDFMQSTLDQIMDALTRPGFRPPAQSSLPLSAMSGPFPVQAGTQPSGTSAAVAQTVASSSSGPAVGATSPQQPVPQQGQPQGQWYPKTPNKPPLAFSGERKDEELNTWLRTVPVWVKAKRTLLEDEVVTAASYLEGKAAKWLDGVVVKAGYGRRMADWPKSMTLDQFMEMVEARWHNPQEAQRATDAINKMDQRYAKDTSKDGGILFPGFKLGKRVRPVEVLAASTQDEVGLIPSPLHDKAKANDSLVTPQTHLDQTMLCTWDVSEALEDLEGEWSNKDPRESWVALKKGPRGEHFVVKVDVGGRKCGAFIDIGSTRNYISRDCLERLHLQNRVRHLSRPVASTLANKERMIVTGYIKDVVCAFSYGGGELNHKISFLVSDDLPFDMLLGMYYLEVAKPQFDWDKKVLKRKLPDRQTVRLTKFKASSIIDTYGCLCTSVFYNYYKQNEEEGMYLVYVSEKGEAVKTPPEIERVVAKFPDLFEEPTGVVEREVVHAIEIIPGMMPFGLCNAPRTFQHAMNQIFHDHLDKLVVIYLNDILIFSKSAKEHAQHVEKVLSLLRQQKYKVNLEKCEFGRTKILYLGHEVSAEGIRPEDAKVASIRDWPRPHTVTEVRSFLGMCGYYRNFVKNYSTVASPLTDLTRLDMPWDWNDECEGAFKRMKHALMNHEVLMVPDPQKPFIVTTDASQYGIGAVLAQQDGKELRPIEYMSKTMPSKKLAKSTYERELYALYKALVHWRHFLLGRFFYLRTDHQTLKWIKTQPALSDALKRWIEVIDQYDFKLEYLKGENNKVADALSRRADYLGALVSDEVTQSLVGAYQEDPVTMDIIRKLQAKDKATESEFVMVDGLLYLDKAGIKRLVVPSSEPLCSLFLGECHDATGHFGYKKTSANLVQRFWWPGMFNDAKKYVETCQVCQRDKPRTQAPLGLLKPLPIPAGPGQSVSMDFMDTLVTSKSGKRHIFVIIDRFTKYARLAAMPETARTDFVIKLFKDNWVRDFGLPKSIVSDRDVRFTSELWKKTAEQMGSQLQMTSGNHPEANGQAGQMNRVVQHLLRHYIKPSQDDWDEQLPLIASLYNNAIHSSTGVSPNQLHLRWKPRSALDFLLPENRPAATPGTLEYGVQYEKLLQEAVEHMKKAQQAMIASENQHHRQSTFQVGERVWVKASELGQEFGFSRKLMPQYFGPWEILDIVGDEMDGPTYVIRVPGHLRTHPVFHASKLAPFPETDQFPSRRSMLPPTMDGQVDIDGIVDHRDMPVPKPLGRGRPPKPKREYRVRFRHHTDPKEDRWFTREEVIETAPQVAAEYERLLKGKAPAK
ncbi:hypothetical protein CBR_g8448 [Chara braunii]|uniref:Integrase catalytic domain-containing protein n=1 Tax=Chara braunii TaxID=69332 RepID=A0A388KM64_CHABU|nr:hypothetical protein CBR_g8448 [Chara braunii]|eukprot:GBG71146.1 hypothetical protein CBR_g8448 [Chara braunii]